MIVRCKERSFPVSDGCYKKVYAIYTQEARQDADGKIRYEKERFFNVYESRAVAEEVVRILEEENQ